MFSRQRPKRVFDINGTELKLLAHLRNKQHLFISYGEDYRPAFGKIQSLLSLKINSRFLEPCLAIQLHSVDIYQKDDQKSLVKVFRPDDELVGDKEKSAK